ncbi:hypothetical protein ACFOMD_01660 [Sphingoaurantiacus capsulatus]|uniref:Uncharacterized protein n=1 Tax=Sphingoaurantiacus capsulatus TaxID=1771310 RepID=A0ABV7X7Q4_9SPHN
MSLSPQLEAALSGPSPTWFGALKIELPGHILRLLDGAGFVDFDGGTFVGRDPVYGVLAAIEEIGDGVGDEAPAIGITLHPASDASAAALAAPGMQGSRVSLFVGAVDRATGLVVPDPELVFVGELDVPTLRSTRNGRSLDFDVVSTFERFFDDDEGARLSDGFHQSVWPGELGLAHVTGVEKTVYWGMDAPPDAKAKASAAGIPAWRQTAGMRF